MACASAGPCFSQKQNMLNEPSNLAAIAAIAAPLFAVLLFALHRRAAAVHRSRQLARVRGFTLIERVIVIAIVALLVTVALPSYRDHVRKSRRAEAQAYLMSVAGRQAQFLVDTRGYAATLATINIPQPASVQASYTVTLNAVAGPPPTFTLTATPTTGTDQVYEKCGTLTINQAGAKTAALSSCW
jgi:type IV pilus assembly protein PilE